MPYPTYQEMDEPLLVFVFLNGGAGYAVSAGAAYRPLADFFELTEEERAKARSDGYGGSKWENRVQWARQRLINRGLLNGDTHGIWRLTGEGIERASRVAGGLQRLKT